MTSALKVSIIIPLYVITKRFFRDLDKYEKLTYGSYEILVVCDHKVDIKKYKKTKLVLTGLKRTGPAEKRDIALEYAKGSICAFIDDDAYPHANWLNEGLKSLNDKNVVAVGGPGVTPKGDPYMAQLTGLVYESVFASGQAQDRFLPLNKRQNVKDWPAYNLMVRTENLKKVGGYGSSFYGGEDTFLCLKLIKDGQVIAYNPKMLVYHHRRPLFIPFMKQIYNVGIHRGFFAKRFPETSRKPFYFLPSVLTLGFFSLLLAGFYNQLIALLFAALFAVFFILALISVIRKTNVLGAILAACGIIIIHLTYGTGFIKGLLVKKLSR